MAIALLGHGTVGTGVDEISSRFEGLFIKKILSRRVHPELAGRETLSFEDILNDPTIDTVCEVMGGVHPAYEYLSSAMKAGKHVVTANKAVVAAYYRELTGLAKEHHVSFRCTAAVGGGIPWLTALERAGKTDCITEISGIMNGTTNYILSSMESGLDYASVLSEAQSLGYAEADPTADVCGFDVRRKIAISANIAFGVVLSEDDVPTFGIETISGEDFTHAKSLGCAIRLIASAQKTADGVSVYVMPKFVSAASLEANVRQNYNLLSLTSENGGPRSFYGQGAGRYPTASNVVSDLADVAENHPGFYTDSFEDSQVSLSADKARFYVRTVEKDAFLADQTDDAFLSEITDALSSNTSLSEITSASGRTSTSEAAASDTAVFVTKPVSKREFISWAIEQKKKDLSAFFAEIL